MPVVPIPIANGFYESESLPISAQECVNWYPNIVQSAGLAQETLFGTPGTSSLATTGTTQNVNRGAHVKNGIPYFVNGNALYVLTRTVNPDLTETFSAVSLGAVEGSGGVSMADNGTQLMILVPGGKGYIYDEDAGTPFLEITDLDFTANGAPQYVVFIDGYFAVTTDSKKWIISALNDGNTWDALDFSSAESDPDTIVAPIVFRNRLFITGSETTEAFQNAPNGAGFPFIRSNVFMEKGCFAPLSLIAAHNTFMMIGGGVNESPAIWQFAGSTFNKVSTTAIDKVLSSFTDAEIAAAFSFSYSAKGAYFVGFTIVDVTFVYDVITQRWHERKSEIDFVQARWRVNSLVTAYGRLLVGDSQDGRIGELSDEIYTEYDDNIQRVIATQPFSNQGNSVKVSMIEITVESGVGNSDRPDPKISMDISDDAKIYKYERSRPMGKVGEYDRRAVWYKNGRAPRFRIFRFKMSDPVKPVIIKLEAKVA
jgi:hypothetical protein